MPLPENGAPWPPAQFAGEFRDMRIDDAWYAGDRDRLTKIYAGNQTRADGSRRLWGRRPPAPGRPDTRMHIPLAGDIANTSAALLFSEPPTFTVPDSSTQARLDELAEVGGIANTLFEAAEVSAALGGVYLRVTWDAQLAERPLLTVVHADSAIPEVRFGLLTAVTFWHELPSDTATVWRHLERHERGAITHGLYQGDRDRLGVRVPLTEHPAVAGIAGSLGEQGDTIETGLDQITAAYVPNMGPNRRHRGSPLGRSDFQAPIHDLFDALDTTWSSWMRDLKLARARLIVPSGYLRSNGPGEGASFDLDREIWQPLNIPPTESGAAGITLSQFAIRVEEHSRSAEGIVRQAVQSAGYSAQTFGLGEGPAVTATEVTARERRSMITRDVKARYWAPAVADMLHAMLKLDRVLGFSRVATDERPHIQFGDSVSEDPKTTAETLSLLAQAEAASTETKVRILHPDWSDEQVQAEVTLIQGEVGTAVPDPITGAPSTPPQPAQQQDDTELPFAA